MEINIPLSGLSTGELKKLIKENKEVLKEKGISLAGAVEKSDLIAALDKAGIQPKVQGFEAIKYKSKLILQYVHNLEYTATFAPLADMGLELRSNNEWASVVQGPESVSRGSVVVAVNGKSVLLQTYTEAIQAMIDAKSSGEAFNITFRRAPWKTGTLWKAARQKSNKQKVSGLGWKKRYFVLAYGMLAYYDKKGGKLKGHYNLDSVTGHQTIVAPAPASVLAAADSAAIMIVKGSDRLIMKSSNAEELMDWAAMLYMAVAHTNGGNTEMYEAEMNRMRLQADREEYQEWMRNAAAKAEADRMQMYVDLAAAEAHAQSLRDAEATKSTEEADPQAAAAAVELAEAEKVVSKRRASVAAVTARESMLVAATAGAEDGAGDATVDVDVEEEPASPAAHGGAAEEPAASSEPSEPKNVEEIMADMNAAEQAEVEKAVERASMAADVDHDAGVFEDDEEEEEEEEAAEAEPAEGAAAEEEPPAPPAAEEGTAEEPPAAPADGTPVITNVRASVGEDDGSHEAGLLKAEPMPDFNEAAGTTSSTPKKMKVMGATSWIKHNKF